MGVTIYEQAVKPTVNLEDGVTVYVPGYSYFGPEEPTLCQTESEFEGLFGSTPYLFEEDQTVSKISKGSPEKGYLYAKSLLASGLRVLFHRYKAPGAKTAEAEIPLTYGEETYTLLARAISFGPGYKGTKVLLTVREEGGGLCDLIISRDGSNVYEGVVSLDPSNALYLKLVNFPLVKFMAKNSAGEAVEIEDAILEQISKGDFEVGSDGVILTYSGEDEIEFYLDDSKKGMLQSLGDSSSKGMMKPLSDFERYPSIAYITSGGYYINTSVAGNLLAVAKKISANALIDINLGVKDQTTWLAAKDTLAKISGDSVAKGKGAHFLGCNSFDLSPYRVVLGDSFNYLKCLGENMKNGIASWIPVANDPNGVSPNGYDTTQRIDSELAETISEGKIGVSSNAIIYSQSAGGYKIMGNRTLLSNDGVLGPNSFLNVSVVVSRVERAARQTANKLKIVSTDPKATFNKFKLSMAKTLDPMVTTGDGLYSYKINHLKKTESATIDIQIALVVVEGIEKFNIYIPYQIQLD